jgi:hypothetical protein
VCAEQWQNTGFFWLTWVNGLQNPKNLTPYRRLLSGKQDYRADEGERANYRERAEIRLFPV